MLYVRNSTLGAFLFCVLAIPQFAAAVAQYHGRLVVEAEIAPRDRDLVASSLDLSVYDAAPTPMNGVTFTPGGSNWALDIAQTIFFTVECDGIADWNGEGDAAIATGACVSSGEFLISNANPDPKVFEVRLKIREFALSGSVDLGVSELAGTELYVILEPSTGITGDHPNPVWSFARHTRDDHIDSYDIVGLPTGVNLGFEFPGAVDPEHPDQFIFQFISLRVRVGILGHAISLFERMGTSLPLTSEPPPPNDPLPLIDAGSRIERLREFYEEQIDAGLLFGEGGNKKKLKEFSHLLKEFASLWKRKQGLKACDPLLRTLYHSDGFKTPVPDLVSGPSKPELQRQILDLARNGLHCPTPNPLE